MGYAVSAADARSSANSVTDFSFPLNTVRCAGRAVGFRCVDAHLPGMRLCPVGHSLVPANSPVLMRIQHSNILPAADASGFMAA
jgi:hypothetical protein